MIPSAPEGLHEDVRGWLVEDIKAVIQAGLPEPDTGLVALAAHRLTSAPLRSLIPEERRQKGPPRVWPWQQASRLLRVLPPLASRKSREPRQPRAEQEQGGTEVGDGTDGRRKG